MEVLELMLGASLVGALTCYVLTGGADFGAGIWTLFALGSTGEKERALIDQAIGPIWEANHVWLIVAVTILFTAFPAAFSLIATALHIPLSIMLVGIVLRGTAFAVRTHDISAEAKGRSTTPKVWRYVFGGSSVFTPMLLGIALGAVASGRLPMAVSPGSFSQRFVFPWLAPFPISVGVLTVTLVAYLAAAYLLVEAGERGLRNVFARRTVASGVTVLVTGGTAFWLARDGAPEIYAGLTQTPIGLLAIGLTVAFHTAAISAVWRGRDRAARWFAVGGAVGMLWGWAISQFPFLVEPHLTIAHASPPPTLRILLISLVSGSLVLFPLLYYLYRLFKGRVLHGSRE
ncbi:MAG TPA: cytochrome d ubiquinol oxidase subunit II [Nitrospira sp.]|nr:cytochrome d ubiquinol oxidase subunit II [Nitrospira sp.]